LEFFFSIFAFLLSPDPYSNGGIEGESSTGRGFFMFAIGYLFYPKRFLGTTELFALVEELIFEVFTTPSSLSPLFN
jgi:hypothetical protein